MEKMDNEYVKALREHHNLNHQTKEATLKEGYVILIKGEERNRQVTRGAQLRAGKAHIERPL